MEGERAPELVEDWDHYAVYEWSRRRIRIPIVFRSKRKLKKRRRNWAAMGTQYRHSQEEPAKSTSNSKRELNEVDDSCDILRKIDSLRLEKMWTYQEGGYKKTGSTEYTT